MNQYKWWFCMCFFESFSLDTIITDKMMMVEYPGLSLCGFFLEVFGNWFQISLLNVQTSFFAWWTAAWWVIWAWVKIGVPEKFWPTTLRVQCVDPDTTLPFKCVNCWHECVTLWLCQKSYWKWPFIVELSINNDDFP